MINNGNVQDEELEAALRHLDLIHAANEKISKLILKKNLRKILLVSDGIIERVTKKPELKKNISRFLNLHLPSMLSMIEDYLEMEQQPVRGENMISAKVKIEEAFDLLESALKKLLDDLYSSSVINLDADVDVLENILKSDGLLKTNSLESFRGES